MEISDVGEPLGNDAKGQSCRHLSAIKSATPCSIPILAIISFPTSNRSHHIHYEQIEHASCNTAFAPPYIPINRAFPFVRRGAGTGVSSRLRLEYPKDAH
ncbi:hypothetical protein J6590_035279 [Homalodisca vitripennis]|nr:hypothetical protein J6590_035279 [Homalodisca vitripennis]